MQFLGVMFLVGGYSSIYTAVQMLKRPPGGKSGSVLYWATGIDSLGAPTAGKGSPGSATGGKRNKKPAATPKNQTLPNTGAASGRTGRGTHTR